jgi:hypothetical protein
MEERVLRIFIGVRTLSPLHKPSPPHSNFIELIGTTTEVLYCTLLKLDYRSKSTQPGYCTVVCHSFLVAEISAICIKSPHRYVPYSSTAVVN